MRNKTKNGKTLIDIRLTTDQDHHSWDSYVNEHPDTSPYHLQAWIRTIEETYGHNGFSLIAYEGGQVVGVLPIIQMCPPLFLPSKFSSLPFCDVGGCLCNNPNIKAALMGAAIDLTAKIGAKKFEIRESSYNYQPGTQLSTNEKSKKYRMVMSLPDTSDELWKSFKSKLRSQVRKSEKNGLTHTNGQGNEYIDGFYKVFSRNMRDLGSPVHSKRWFESIRKHYAQDMFISLVKMDEKVIGAGLVLLLKRTATVPWASIILKLSTFWVFTIWGNDKVSSD